MMNPLCSALFQLSYSMHYCLLCSPYNAFDGFSCPPAHCKVFFTVVQLSALNVLLLVSYLSFESGFIHFKCLYTSVSLTDLCKIRLFLHTAGM